MNGEAPLPSPLEDDDPGGSNLAGVLLSLGVAVVVGVFVLRAALPDAPALPPAAVVATSYPEDIPLIIDTVLPPPPAGSRPALVLRRPNPGKPEPWQFVTIAEAGRRLALPVVAPASLPEGHFLQVVRWQLDSYVTIPGQSLNGILQAWYASEEAGGVFMLEQGPGVGISDFAAPEGETGQIALSDGRRLLWVRGHRLRTDDAPGGGGWGGTELRLGVRSGSTRGWRLTTRSLTLEELVAIAEGLR